MCNILKMLRNQVAHASKQLNEVVKLWFWLKIKKLKYFAEHKPFIITCLLLLFNYTGFLQHNLEGAIITNLQRNLLVKLLLKC